MNKKIRWLKLMAVGGLFAAALAISGASNAQVPIPVNIVQNGDFTSDTPNTFFAGDANWSSTGPFTFIYGPGGADAIGVSGLYLWGPNNPAPGPNSMNGLPATSPLPNGGNYLASDADPICCARPITQIIPHNLGTLDSINVGQHYYLNFDYAEAQFRNQNGTLYNGATQSGWQVSLGLTPLTTTPELLIPSHGFSGWQTASVPFTATVAEATSGLLSFLAVSPNVGLPPVALLDSVSIFPMCGSGTVASYIGTACQTGDKVFSNFKYSTTAIGNGVASDAAHTLLTPINSGNNEGFDIQGLWDAGPGGAADGVLSYTVQSVDGLSIDDASLSLTGSAIGGFATVGETICKGAMLSNCPSAQSATLQAELPGPATDTINFLPTDIVDVSKDIDVFGGTGFASLSDVINTVSQTTSTCPPLCDPPDPPTVPEPPSLALLCVGLAGLAGVGLIRRRRYSAGAAPEVCAAL